MNNRFALVMILVFGVGSVFAHRDSAPVEPGIRFVDSTRCMEEVPAILQEVEKIRDSFGPILNQLRDKEKELQVLAGELSVLSPQSKEYLEQSHQLETDRIGLERQHKFQIEQFQKAQGKAWIRATRLIHETAAELGRQKGYAGIMVKPLRLENLSPEISLAVDALQGRRLLWSHPEYDITQEVIDFLADNP